MFIVFDLDGTLSDGSHKTHLLTPPSEPGGEWPEQDWAPWIAASIDDTLIQPIAACARAMIDAGHKVEFWTGRGEGMRDVTRRWMRKHGFRRIPLRMRPSGEPTTPDHIVKGSYIERFGTPDLIFEDRTSVVDEWRRRGIICAQVAPGLF